MKKLTTLSCAIISFFFLMNPAIARVAVFISPNETSQNLCDKVMGTWKGRGNIKAIFADCIYEGSATIAGNKKLTLSTDIKKVSGPEWCQKQFQIKLDGVCENNIAEFNHPELHLSGNTQGGTIQLEGTITLAMNAYVEIEMNKKSSS